MSVNSKFTRAVGLIRVSTGEQTLSVGAQQHAIAEFCQENDLELLDTFSDIGISGGAKITERPALLEALSHINRTTCLVAARLDRVSRSGLVHALVLQNCEESNSALYSCSEDNSTTAEATFLRNVLMAVSQLEKSLIADRTKKALLQIRRTGCKFSRSKFGVDYSSGGPGVVNEGEQETLALMRRLREAGATFTSIAEELNASGMLRRGGKEWSRQAVRRTHVNDMKHNELTRKVA